MEWIPAGQRNCIGLVRDAPSLDDIPARQNLVDARRSWIRLTEVHAVPVRHHAAPHHLRTPAARSFVMFGINR